MEPLVSVIVVTYNRAHFLKDALDSIQRQTFRDYEIILVDDGSTDNTKEIVEQYVLRITLKKLWNSTKQSVTFIRNMVAFPKHVILP